MKITLVLLITLGTVVLGTAIGWLLPSQPAITPTSAAGARPAKKSAPTVAFEATKTDSITLTPEKLESVIAERVERQVKKEIEDAKQAEIEKEKEHWRQILTHTDEKLSKHPDLQGPVMTKMRAALFNPDHQEATTNLKKLLSEVTPGTVRELSLYWRLVHGMHPYGNQLAPIVNHRLGELDGPYLVGTRTGDTKEDEFGLTHFVLHQFTGWMTADPTAAEKWLEGLQNQEYKENLRTLYNEAIAP